MVSFPVCLLQWCHKPQAHRGQPYPRSRPCHFHSPNAHGGEDGRQKLGCADVAATNSVNTDGPSKVGEGKGSYGLNSLQKSQPASWEYTSNGPPGPLRLTGICLTELAQRQRKAKPEDPASCCSPVSASNLLVWGGTQGGGEEQSKPRSRIMPKRDGEYSQVTIQQLRGID